MIHYRISLVIYYDNEPQYYLIIISATVSERIVSVIYELFYHEPMPV
jgi:hypothetical protein